VFDLWKKIDDLKEKIEKLEEEEVVK